MTSFWRNALTHWKSSLGGFLTVTLATSAALMTYPPIAAHVKLMSILGGIQIVGKVWVSLISQDAGVVVATSPGDPTPHAEPSHEVPDAPLAKAVLPEVKS